MTTQNIIDLARDLTHTTSTQITDNQALNYLNIVYHDIENSIITNINEDYFWDTFSTDTVGGQNEYSLPLSTAVSNGVRKVIDARIKWDDDSEYQKLSSNSSNNFNEGIDYLKDNLNPTNSYYELKEGSIFIYPAPQESVLNGLKIESIVTLKDLTITDTEDDVFPNQSSIRQFHHVLAIGMKQYIYSQQRQFGEKDNAIQEYELAKQKLIEYLDERNSSPSEGYVPYGINLMI